MSSWVTRKVKREQRASPKMTQPGLALAHQVSVQIRKKCPSPHIQPLSEFPCPQGCTWTRLGSHLPSQPNVYLPWTECNSVLADWPHFLWKWVKLNTFSLEQNCPSQCDFLRPIHRAENKVWSFPEPPGWPEPMKQGKEAPVGGAPLPIPQFLPDHQGGSALLLCPKVSAGIRQQQGLL